MEHQETLKNAARRMCEHMAQSGVTVKHSLMLESIAVGFGLDNWRTLKAVIDAPRATVPRELPEGEEQSWSVEALYADNDQQYGDSMTARTALEAAYAVMMERLTDCGLVVNILSVCNEQGRVLLSPSFLHEYEPVDQRVALASLSKAVAAVPAHSLTAHQQLAQAWLSEVLRTYEKPAELNDLTDSFVQEACASRAGHPVFEGESMTPSEALQLLCAVVEHHAGGIVALEKADESLACHLHQVSALACYFEDVLNSAEYGLAMMDRAE